MNCTNCQIVINDEVYRVNQNGEYFCTDNCYDKYTEDNVNSPNDSNHPYIDIYENIRSAYIDWLHNWEEELEKSYPDNPQYKADEVNDQIDEILHKHNDFYITKGDDGIFSQEIFLYLIKFKKLQKDILVWRPARETYYYLSMGYLLEIAEIKIHDWTDFSKYLYEIKADRLFFLLKDNVHPYDELAFYFEDKSQLDEVIQEIGIVFGEDLMEDVSYYEAYICEGECHDYEVIDDVDIQAQNGWFFCCSCEDSYYPGYFSKEVLMEDLCLDNVQDIQLKYSKTPNWHYYIRKIKRSCRYHDIDFPDWIEFNYNY